MAGYFFYQYYYCCTWQPGPVSGPLTNIHQQPRIPATNSARRIMEGNALSRRLATIRKKPAGKVGWAHSQPPIHPVAGQTGLSRGKSQAAFCGFWTRTTFPTQTGKWSYWESSSLSWCPCCVWALVTVPHWQWVSTDNPSFPGARGESMSGTSHAAILWPGPTSSSPQKKLGSQPKMLRRKNKTITIISCKITSSPPSQQRLWDPGDQSDWNSSRTSVLESKRRQVKGDQLPTSSNL